MAGSDSKQRPRRTRLPILPPPVTGRALVPGTVGLRLGPDGEESIYTLRGYKAWAARVKAAWDAET